MHMRSAIQAHTHRSNHQHYTTQRQAAILRVLSRSWSAHVRRMMLPQQQERQQEQDCTSRQPDTLTLHRRLARLLAQGYHRASSSQLNASMRIPSATFISCPPLLSGWRSQLHEALHRALVLPRPSNRVEEGGDDSREDEETMEWFWNALAPPQHRHRPQYKERQHHTRGGGGHRSPRDGDDALSQWSCPAAVASGLCEEVCRALLALQQTQQTEVMARRVLGLILMHVAAGGGEAGEGRQGKAEGGGLGKEKKRSGLEPEAVMRSKGSRSVPASPVLSFSTPLLVALQTSLTLGPALSPAQLNVTILPCFFVSASSHFRPRPPPTLSPVATARLLAVAGRLPQQLSVPLVVALLRALRQEEEKLGERGEGGNLGCEALKGQERERGGRGDSARNGSEGAGRPDSRSDDHVAEQEETRPQLTRTVAARQGASSLSSPPPAVVADVYYLLDRVLQLFLSCLHDILFRSPTHMQDALASALQLTAASFAPASPPARPRSWVFHSVALLLHVIRARGEGSGLLGAGKKNELEKKKGCSTSSSDGSGSGSSSSKSSKAEVFFSHHSCLPPSTLFSTTHVFLSSLAINYGLFPPAPPKPIPALLLAGLPSSPPPPFPPPNKVDPLLAVPPVVALHLLSFLNPKRLAKAEAVSPAWYHFLSSPLADSLLWRPLLPLLHAPSTADSQEEREGERAYRWESRQGHRLWRELYRRRNKVWRRLRKSRWGGQSVPMMCQEGYHAADTDVYTPPLLCGAAFLDLEEGERLTECDAGGSPVAPSCPRYSPGQRLFRVLFTDLMKVDSSSGFDLRGEEGGEDGQESAYGALPSLCQHCGGLQELSSWWPTGEMRGTKELRGEPKREKDEEEEEKTAGGGEGGGNRRSSKRSQTEILAGDAQAEEKGGGVGREERAARACMLLGRYVHYYRSKRTSSTRTSSRSKATHGTIESKRVVPSSRWKDVFGTRLQCETSLLSSFKQAVRAWRAMREREDAATWQVKKGTKRVAVLSAAVHEHSLRRVCRVVGCVAIVTPDNVVEHTAWHGVMARAGGKEELGGETEVKCTGRIQREALEWRGGR